MHWNHLYFVKNPFKADAEDSWYAAEFADGITNEWCLHTNEEEYIDAVSIKGENAWYMTDHAFWSEDFSRKFLHIIEMEWQESKDKLWETIFLEHLDVLKMRVKKYPPCTVFEFDSLDALRDFDESYKSFSRSEIMRLIAERLSVSESEIVNIKPIMGEGTEARGFYFDCDGRSYQYLYEHGTMEERKRDNWRS